MTRQIISAQWSKEDAAQEGMPVAERTLKRIITNSIVVNIRIFEISWQVCRSILLGCYEVHQKLG